MVIACQASVLAVLSGNNIPELTALKSNVRAAMVGMTLIPPYLRKFHEMVRKRIKIIGEANLLYNIAFVCIRNAWLVFEAYMLDVICYKNYTIDDRT